MFARHVLVVTFEFENVPAATAAAAAAQTLVRPGGESPAYHAESVAGEGIPVRQQGFPVTRFRAVRSLDDLAAEPPLAILAFPPSQDRVIRL